jgi:hypothetical protein
MNNLIIIINQLMEQEVRIAPGEIRGRKPSAGCNKRRSASARAFFALRQSRLKRVFWCLCFSWKTLIFDEPHGYVT